ncbi:hypothetical protein AVEN_10672-1 [Araneus ventricosus]|uniref:Uncharacterized protein n=1 Tax=Araneus ventricosus TaxID=182803 RepID=A0A4Y2ET01_ARAVE|nr:hypothetical protein AVEN_10672-1 [Araneus ventricosus]
MRPFQQKDRFLPQGIDSALGRGAAAARGGARPHSNVRNDDSRVKNSPPSFFFTLLLFQNSRCDRKKGRVQEGGGRLSICLGQVVKERKGGGIRTLWCPPKCRRNKGGWPNDSRGAKKNAIESCLFAPMSVRCRCAVIFRMGRFFISLHELIDSFRL